MYKFNNMTQTFEEIEDPRVENLKLLKRVVIVIPIMVLALVVAFSLINHHFQNEMKELQHTQSAKHQTNQGISQ